MTHIKAHFDGKVIVPDEPLNLRPHERIIITVRPCDSASVAAPGTADSIRQHMKGYEISDEDAELMLAAIEENCERIDPDPDVEFDTIPDGHERRGGGNSKP